MPFRNSIIGGNGSLVRDAIQSPNFSVSPDVGVTGWQIAKDGSATFSDVTIGSPYWVINSNGDASLRTLDITGIDSNGDGVPDTGFTVYGKEFNSYIWERPWGVVKSSATGALPMTACTTEVGLGELSFTTVAGRFYRLTVMPPFIYVTGAAKAVAFRVRNTIGSGAISIANGALWEEREYPCDIYSRSGPAEFSLDFTGNGQQFRFLLCAIAGGGGGTPNVYTNAVRSMRMSIVDLGPAVNGGQAWVFNNGGGTGAPNTQQYVSTWQVTDSASYRADGSTRTDTTDVVQGYYSTNGNQHGKFVFNGGAISGQTGVSLASAMTGLTSLDRIEIYVYANHWYWGTGGTAIIRPWNSTALSNSVPSGSYQASGSWGANVGRWVDISSIASSAIRGFSLGQGLSNDGLYYGRFDGVNGTNKALLRATYTK